jgi:hypothetical protein
MTVQETADGLPPLSGCYRHTERHTYSGYNTDLEEMDAWSEWETAYLHFSEDGTVRAAVGTDDDGAFATSEAEGRTAVALPGRPANGTWRRANLEGRIGYVVELNLRYGIPAFWQSHGGPSEVFLWWEDGTLKAQRFWTGGGWGTDERILERWEADG